MQKLIVHPDTVKLMAYPDKVEAEGKKGKVDTPIKGALFKISFLFGPYMLQLPEELTWKSAESMTNMRNTLLDKFTKSMEVVDYNAGYWFYYLDHELVSSNLGRSGVLLIHLTKRKGQN